MARRIELPASSFTDFGTLLRVLRRAARLTQRDLGIAVGYSEAQISRLEQGKRLPDPSVVAALFVPSLRLANEPELASRLHVLAQAARDSRGWPEPAASDDRRDGRRTSSWRDSSRSGWAGSTGRRRARSSSGWPATCYPLGWPAA